MKKQQGFTLIELVMVIVILGILAAVAIPQFVDLSGEAELAAANGVYGAAESAAVINYSAGLVGATAPVPAGIANAGDLVTALEGGAAPDGWSTTGNFLCIDDTAPAGCSAADTYYIEVTAAEVVGTSKATLSKSW